MTTSVMQHFINNGIVERINGRLKITWESEEKLLRVFKAKKISAMFHFTNEGKIAFDETPGRDENGDFYNEKNGNLADRQAFIKLVIATELAEQYKNAIK